MADEIEKLKKELEEANENCVRWTKQRDEISTKYYRLNSEHERLKNKYAALRKRAGVLEGEE